MNTNFPFKYLIAALIGAAHSWLAVVFWGRYAINNPINDWLLEVFAKKGHSALYYISIYTHDFIVNVLLATPAALALVVLVGSDNWRALAVAVATAIFVGYWGMELSSLPMLIRSWGFWVGLAMSLFSLPIAFATIRAFRRQPIIA